MKKFHLIILTVFPVFFFSQSIKGLNIPDSLKNKRYGYTVLSGLTTAIITSGNTNIYSGIFSNCTIKGYTGNTSNYFPKIEN